MKYMPLISIFLSINATALCMETKNLKEIIVHNQTEKSVTARIVTLEHTKAKCSFHKPYMVGTIPPKDKCEFLVNLNDVNYPTKNTDNFYTLALVIHYNKHLRATFDQPYNATCNHFVVKTYKEEYQWPQLVIQNRYPQSSKY